MLPVTLALATASMVRFRAWPFFVQERIGHLGTTFNVIKIRSLPKSFPSTVGKHELAEDGVGSYSTFLRSTHLDELPQLLNVLNGTMSLVGPRPMIQEVIALLDPACRHQRHLVPPGLTGPWQLSTMGAHSLHECPELDTAYVEHASARNDIWMLTQTLRNLFGHPPLEPDALLKRMST